MFEENIFQFCAKKMDLSMLSLIHNFLLLGKQQQKTLDIDIGRQYCAKIGHQTNNNYYKIWIDIKWLIFVKSKRMIINNKEFYFIWDRLATEMYELHHIETFLNTNEKSMPILVYFISTNSQSCIFQLAWSVSNDKHKHYMLKAHIMFMG